MKPTVMYSYNNGEGSGLVAKALGINRLKHHHSNYVANPRKVLINWGGRAMPDIQGHFGRVLNHPHKLPLIINKAAFFNFIKARPQNAPQVPDSTTSQATAAAWLQQGFIVVERHSLEGQAGAGIVIVPPRGKLNPAPLYTKYIDKDAEYRIHVVGGKVIFKQQKVRRDGQAVKDDYVRSLHNGYIFREKVKNNMPEDVIHQSLKVMSKFDLDFGAVDVITQGRNAYVLEINSAPGIDPNSRLSTLYAEAFRELIGD